MFVMKKLTAFIVLVLLAACSPTPTVISTFPVSADSLITASPQDILSTPIQPTVISVPGASGLWLQILTPLDETVVNAPQVDVTVSAPVGTVFSINEEILVVDSGLQSRITVSLEEGPNLIEIIASDENGNELSALLTVTYEP